MSRSIITIFLKFVCFLYYFFLLLLHIGGNFCVTLFDDFHLLFVKRGYHTYEVNSLDVTSALLHSYSAIKQVLDNISNNIDQKADCRQQARRLLSTMMNLKTGIIVILCDHVLHCFQTKRSSFQSPD